MNAAGGKGRNGGNGSSGGFSNGGFEGEFIKDRDDEFGEEWSNPRAEHDPYTDHSTGRGSRAYAPDRGTAEAITRIIEMLAGAASDALPPEARRQLERVLRDLLVIARDSLNLMIDRIDQHEHNDIEIEEIPIDLSRSRP